MAAMLALSSGCVARVPESRHPRPRQIGALLVFEDEFSNGDWRRLDGPDPYRDGLEEFGRAGAAGYVHAIGNNTCTLPEWQGDDYPVTCILPVEVAEVLNRLSDEQGLVRAFVVNEDEPTMDPLADGWRLPTCSELPALWDESARNTISYDPSVPQQRSVETVAYGAGIRHLTSNVVEGTWCLETEESELASGSASPLTVRKNDVLVALGGGYFGKVQPLPGWPAFDVRRYRWGTHDTRSDIGRRFLTGFRPVRNAD